MKHDTKRLTLHCERAVISGRLIIGQLVMGRWKRFALFLPQTTTLSIIKITTKF